MLAGAQSVLRFDTHPSDDPYLAAGDGVTDDSAAFAAFEIAATGRTIDLRGRSFKLSAYPTKNQYVNGRFVVAKSTTIGGAADAYSWYAGAAKLGPMPALINLFRDARTTRSGELFRLTQTAGLQGVAFDEVNNSGVGLTEATAEGTFYEPEALAMIRPDFSAPPALCMVIVSAGGGAHVNRVWALGYNSTIAEGRGTLAAGRWTPTATPGTNVAAATPGSAHYTRIGNIVHFSGRITIDPTATGFTSLELSLPIASNFTSLTDAAGVFNALGVNGVATTVDTGAIEGSVANDTLVLSFITGDTANRAYYYTGSYEVK
jgi:hypothetical protein